MGWRSGVDLTPAPFFMTAAATLAFFRSASCAEALHRRSDFASVIALEEHGTAPCWRRIPKDAALIPGQRMVYPPGSASIPFTVASTSAKWGDG